MAERILFQVQQLPLNFYEILPRHETISLILPKMNLTGPPRYTYEYIIVEVLYLLYQ